MQHKVLITSEVRMQIFGKNFWRLWKFERNFERDLKYRDIVGNELAYDLARTGRLARTLVRSEGRNMAERDRHWLQTIDLVNITIIISVWLYRLYVNQFMKKLIDMKHVTLNVLRFDTKNIKNWLVSPYNHTQPSAQNNTNRHRINRSAVCLLRIIVLYLITS